MVTQQNAFLYHTIAIPVLHGGHCDQRFDDDGFTVVEMAMRNRVKDRRHFFTQSSREELGSATFMYKFTTG